MSYEHERTIPRKPSRANTQPFPPRDREGYGTLSKYLESRGLSPQVADREGWYISHAAGDAETRVVMPADSQIEGHNYWQARAISKSARVRYQSPPCARLDAVIVVYPNQAGNGGVAVVCEGPMDALAVADLGYLGIALMGNQPPDEVVDHVVTLVGKHQTFVLSDRDAEQNWTAIFQRLINRGVRATKIGLANYKDIAAMPKDARERFFTKIGRLTS